MDGIGPIFLASFPGDCAECTDVIVEGDSVRYVDGELMHEECADEEDEPASGWGRHLKVVK